MDINKKYKLQLILISGYILLLFAMSIILLYIKDEYPGLYEKIATPLAIGIAVLGVLGLVLLVIFYGKILTTAMEYKSEKIKGTMKDFSISKRPIFEKKELKLQIKNQLINKGFKVKDDIVIKESFQGFVAHNTGRYQLFEKLERYIFLLEGEIISTRQIEQLVKNTYTYFENNSTKQFGKMPYHQIVLCILQDDVSMEIAHKIKE